MFDVIVLNEELEDVQQRLPEARERVSERYALYLDAKSFYEETAAERFVEYKTNLSFTEPGTGKEKAFTDTLAKEMVKRSTNVISARIEMNNTHKRWQQAQDELHNVLDRLSIVRQKIGIINAELNPYNH